MILSRVVLCGRSASAQRLLADLYRQHQFVLSAFPDADGGPAGAVQHEGRPTALFRTESAEGGRRVSVLVQSEERPDWDRAGDLHPGTVQAAETRDLRPSFGSGQVMRFRLRANPTMMRVNGDIEVRADHQRVGLYREEEQLDWLRRHAERSGFDLPSGVIVTSLGVRIGQKSPVGSAGRGHVVRCLQVEFDGLLRVLDPDLLASALRTGIGRGKAWGCGLLSLARA